ncbi:MAG: penicillin-binding protein 2 [Candidatus Staskawiczbacteria bacterium]|nr:penicillin-binding protein 2 [Candidatus Staskawiczbacteria bacterium]
MKLRFKNWRTNIVLLLIIIFGAAIISRLFFLQILERKLFSAQALGQQVGFSTVTGARGQIYCSGSGEVKSLAINKDSWTISASLKDIPDKEVFAKTLSENINQTKDQIISEISSHDNYAVIEKDVSQEQADKIKNLNLKGLSLEKATERYYPQGQFAPQVLGFLGGESSGQYGIEGYYDDVLKGKTGVQEEQTGFSSVFSSAGEASLDGSDIYLTIDYNIQLQAESLLRQAKDNLDIESGQIIVLKPDTGKILAMANYPNFDLNQYSKESDLAIFQNSAVQKLFEPGSIMKPFTMASALNEGKITPETTYVDTGVVKFGTKTIHNYGNEVYGKQTMTGVLENSINTGAIFAEQQMDHKLFFSYLDKFGFFEKTGIDLQGEVYSHNDLLKNGQDMEYATASFGQGIELTPLQIARAFCALANGGKLVKPYIVEKIVNGNDESYTKPEISDPIVSKQTISQLIPMMINVIDGGLPRQKITGYYIAGKTGTAQIPLTNSKGYDPNKTIQSFVGFAPALNPQFLILVKLDNPRASKSALSSVPVFRDLAQYIINYWKIPPDYDINK